MAGGVSYLTENPKKIIKFVSFCQTTSLATPAQCVSVSNTRKSRRSLISSCAVIYCALQQEENMRRELYPPQAILISLHVKKTGLGFQIEN